MELIDKTPAVYLPANYTLKLTEKELGLIIQGLTFINSPLEVKLRSLLVQ